MALSNKRKLAKLAKKQKKRKLQLSKRNKTSGYISNSYGEDSVQTFELMKESWSDQYLDKSGLDYFVDEDHHHGDTPYCPVDLIEMTTSDAINELASSLEANFPLDLSRYHYLCLALNGWNLAKQASLSTDLIAVGLSSEIDCEILSKDKAEETLQYVIDEVNNNGLYKLLNVLVVDMILSKFTSEDRGGIIVNVAVNKGEKKKVLDNAAMIDELLEKRRGLLEMDEEKLLA
ncbi:hypothetical protein PsalMR5_04287 (plasmid) [Piscirickettsia salmonis]|uniref:hypothetical protein n=1 Tax=Piscirickettsia salmonis TaxID=1238 RepID=UPI0012BA7800|nr:hypothetical protein [Piscirickettsia salmonis]QGP56795.1 hypothetical protein PsalSR1_04284 [Piscirickettsia salmonis]QGP61507.1 hypothetical protein PsalBI1_04149 [Piscirickettsia salmonis]QGP66362.1 hypothetical protein PsalMR5_04287 [Piscirickettsia salmonis]